MSKAVQDLPKEMQPSTSPVSTANDLDGAMPKKGGKRGRKKNKKKQRGIGRACYCSRVLKPGEKSDPDCLVNAVNEMVTANYPAVCRGHKTCLESVVVTPKNMGWLWSLEVNSGVKMHRNWKPGAIPVNVAAVMERARAGETYPGDKLHPERAKRTSGNPLTPNSTPVNVKRNEPIIERKPQPQAQPQRTRNQVDKRTRPAIKSSDSKPKKTGEKPLFALKRKNNQYEIEMNLVRDNKNESGELAGPSRKDEQVRIQLGINDKNASQSSMEIDVRPGMMLLKKKSEKPKITSDDETAANAS